VTAGDQPAAECKPKSRRPLFLAGAGLAVGTLLVIWGLAVSNRSAIDKSVFGQLRLFAAAADQYYLEHGVTTVAYADLVGATNYIQAVHVVADEHYPAFFTQGMPLTATGIAGTRTVTYAP
jgi:hypothetical protein